MPGKRTRDALHRNRPVDPEWDEKCEATWRHLLARPDSGGTFTGKQLFGALGVGYDRVRPVLDRAVGDGRLVQVSLRYGYTRPGLVAGAVTLESLLAAAAQSVDPIAKGTPGRRATDRRERIEVLTRSQFDRMRAAASVAARALGGERGLAGVGSEHFGWTPCATGEPDRGTWTLVDVVARASDEQARVAHEAAGAKRGGTAVQMSAWDPALNKEAREAHTGGIRLLLNWAYTHGHIASVTRLGAEYGVHAAELQPWVERMTAALSAQATSQSMRYTHADGVRVLALHRTHTKQFNDAQIDWARVIDSIEAAGYAEAAPLSATKLRNAKGAYRALCRAHLVTGPGWGARADRIPEGLVCTAVVKHTAETGDFSAWRIRHPDQAQDQSGDAAPAIPTALVSDDAGACSLRRYYQWADGRNSDAALVTLGLPSRAYLDPDRQQAAKEIKARNKGQPLFHNCKSTLRRNLNLLNAYAGWAAAKGGIDFTQQGLEALVDDERFARYCVHWQKVHPEVQSRSGRAAWLQQLAALLGTIASPFLARTAQDSGNATEAARLVCCARDFFLRSLELKPRKNEVSSGKQKLAAWEPRGDDTDAIDRLRAIADAMIEDIERLGGSIQSQIDAIRAGAHHVRDRGKWAVLVRDTAIFLCQCRVALRPGNLCALRHTGPDQTWFVGAGCLPWEGWISYEFPACMMKTCEPFAATLISVRDAEAADARAHLRPDVLELLLMPGGARDALLTYREGGAMRVAASDFVFVTRAQYGDAEERAHRVAAGCPMTVGSLNVQFKLRIRQYARRVGLDPRAVLDVFGAASPHVCRAIAYTAAARAGEASAGARELGHGTGTGTGTATADACYRGERGASPDMIRRRRMGNAAAAGSPDALVAHALELLAAGKISSEAYIATVRALGGQDMASAA